MMARDRVVQAVDGAEVQLEVDTICVHGDTPDAANLAMQIRQALERSGVVIRALGSAIEPAKAP
jgi:UPF0271 protein